MNGLLPQLSPYADYLVSLAPGAQVTSVYRSYSDQLRLWLNRSSNPFPVAYPGTSYHQYGRAFDVVAPIETLRRLGAIWRSWGGRWGEHDVIHFEV